MKSEAEIRAEMGRVRQYLETPLNDGLSMITHYRLEGKKELLEWILE